MHFIFQKDQGYIYLMEYTVKMIDIVQYYYNLNELFFIVIFSCDGKVEFSAAFTPGFRVT